MPPPAIAPLAYEAWIVRRTSANGLRVLHAAIAAGPGDVLVPLPWPEVRLLDEDVTRSTFWAHWSVVAQLPPENPRMGPPSTPPGGELRGEPVARLFSRADLPPDLERRVPAHWQFAHAFLWWPPQRGVQAWLTRVSPSPPPRTPSRGACPG